MKYTEVLPLHYPFSLFCKYIFRLAFEVNSIQIRQSLWWRKSESQDLKTTVNRKKEVLTVINSMFS